MLFAALLYLFDLWPKDRGDLLKTIAIPALVIVAYLILRFMAYYLFSAPRDIYKEQQKEIVNLHSTLEALKGRVGQLTDLEPEENMWEDEILEYALKHSTLTTRPEVETELRKAALRAKDPLVIWAHPEGDSVSFRAPQDIFNDHTIRLPASDKEYGYIYNFKDPKATRWGESLGFNRAQIQRLFKKRKDPN